MLNYIIPVKIAEHYIELKEITYKQFRVLAKCFIGDELNYNTIFTNINNLLTVCTNLSKKNIDNLNFTDYFLLLLYLRAISIGDTINLNYEKDKKNIKLELSLENVINDINSINSNLTKTELDNIQIYHKHPTINDLIFFKENTNYFFNTFFVKQIVINSEQINLLNYNYADREKIIQQLPVKIISTLNRDIQNIFNENYNYNIFNRIKSNLFSEVLPLTPNIDVLSYLAKLLFYSNFENVYENIFVLSKAANMSAEFLDLCTPGEVIFFIKKLEEYNQHAQQENKNSNNQDGLPPVISEFTDDTF